MRNVEPAETLALHSMCSAVSKCHWESLDGSWRSSHYQPHIGRARPAQCCWKKKEHQSCRIPESMSRTLKSRYPASDISHLWVCYLGTNQTSTLKEGNGFSVSRSISFRCFQEIKVPISNASPQLPTGHVLWQQLQAPGLWKSCGPLACGTKILEIAMTGFTNWHLWQNVAWMAWMEWMAWMIIWSCVCTTVSGLTQSGQSARSTERQSVAVADFMKLWNFPGSSDIIWWLKLVKGLDPCVHSHTESLVSSQ